MSKLDPQHVLGTEEAAEDDSPPQGVTAVRGDDVAVSTADQTTQLAEASAPQPVVAPERRLAFERLRSTVEEMAARGASTYAAGVSARLRQTDPDFRFRDLGFSSFKAFLQAAADRGFVEVARPPSASDVFVSIPRAIQGATTSSSAEPRYLNPAVWRLLTSPGAEARRWDRASARLRDAADGPGMDESVNVFLSPIPAEDIVAWMRAFAETVRDAETSKVLASALATSRPADSFREAVRAHQGLSRRWGRYYRDHVTRRAFEWADANEIARSDVVAPPRAGVVGPAISGAGAGSSAARSLLTVKETPAPGRLSGGAEYEALVRSKVTRAVESMSLADLLRLPIPAQYLIGE